MKNSYKRNVCVRGPEDFLSLEVKEAPTYAAGKAGVVAAMKHSFKEMGVVRAMRTLIQMNQKEGFDCPSCAWPDPEEPSKLGEYCENGAKALADEATLSHIDHRFFAQNSVEELSLKTDYQINAYGRITEPLFLGEGEIHYKPISWARAYEMIAEELRNLEHPNEAIFYTSGRSSNEAAFLYGIFARALGTNNMPDCSNMCHESSGVALSETLGIGKGSVKLEDLYGAEVVIVAGQNPGTNHPRMLSALEKCKQNGGVVISINPLQEAGLVHFRNPQTAKGLLGSGTAIADYHLPVRINQDIPLMKVILKKLAKLDALDASVFDHDFLDTYADGKEKLLKDLEQYATTDLLALCGVQESIINQVVSILAKKQKIVVCWAMGLTQHKNGVETIKEYVNLLLLKGAVGRPFAGTCPVRGHSNVQGDRSVGIMHYVNKEFNDRIQKYLGFQAPEKEGVDVVGSIKAMHDGKASVFMALGGNFLMAASDTDYTAEALQNCSLTIQVSTKLNRSHLVTGKKALLLPTYGRSEKEKGEGQNNFVTTENSMGRVRWSKGVLKAPSDTLESEVAIVTGIARAYFKDGHTVDWKSLGEDYNEIRELIDKVVKGFDNTSQKARGIGYYLPNNVRDLDFSKLPGGKAQLSITGLPDHKLAEDEFMLMTIRSHDQFNTTIYGMDDRYRGVFNERRVLFMHPKDVDKLGLEKGAIVHLSSLYDDQLRRVNNFKIVPYQIPEGDVAAYFPETNGLVPYNHYADKSKTPISKSIRIRIIK